MSPRHFATNMERHVAQHAMYESAPRSTNDVAIASHGVCVNAEHMMSAHLAVDVLFGMLAAIVLAQSSHAEESATKAQADSLDAAAQIEEIVVTAAKRAENLQAVPISVAAFSGDAIATGRFTAVDELVTRVVNLQFTSIVGDNTPIFALRGVSMFDYAVDPLKLGAR